MNSLTEKIAHELKIVRGLVVKRISLAVVQQERHVQNDGDKQSELVRLEDEETRCAQHAPRLRHAQIHDDIAQDFVTATGDPSTRC